MKTKSNKYQKKLTVKSTTDNLSRIRDFIKLSADKSGLNTDVICKIILAVDEACTNIIKHSYNYLPEGKIIINVKADNSKFEVSITDDGKKFNPDEVEDPDLKKYYKEKKVGGLGMFLMKKLMDDVKYYKLAENRNKVVLVKYIN